MRRRIASSIAAIVAAIVLASAPSGAATAAENDIPMDITEYVESGELAHVSQAVVAENGGSDTPTPERTELVGGGLPDIPDLSGDVVSGSITELFEFTPEFLAGEDTKVIFAPFETWVSPLMRGDELLAVQFITREATRPAWAGFDADPTLAAAIAELPADAILVVHSANRQYYAIEGDTVRPLPDLSAHPLLTTPLSLHEAQKVFAQQWQVNAEAGDDGEADDLVGGGVGAVHQETPVWPIVAGAGFGLVLSLIVVFLIRRSRRERGAANT